VLLLTLFPIFNIISIISTTGANNPSNDYLRFVQLIGRILDGTYNWQNYFRDTFYNGHCLALLVLVWLAIAKLADWNVYVEMYIGSAMFALELVLLHNAFTCHRKEKLRWLLWPLLAALVFAVSQISIFTFGGLALQMGLNQIGIALGIWGLTRFPRRWLGIGLMALGGAVATLSWSGGIMAWPMFLMGLVLLKFRQVLHYSAWLAAGLLVSLPYAVFMVLQPTPAAIKTAKIVSVMNFRYIASAIGQPFVNGIGTNFTPTFMAGLGGGLGILLCLIGMLILCVRRSAPLLTQSVPAVMLISYGLLSIWQISVFRNTLAPWYTTPAITFWVGLLGLAYTIGVNCRHSPLEGTWVDKTIHWMSPVWSLTVLVVLGLLYAASNVSYEDKTLHLASRSPASAACLRNYQTAPTYCEGYLFQWGVGSPSAVSALAQPLERHHLSVFAPRQQWTLQGDFVLRTVHINEKRNVPGLIWSAGLTASPTPWSSYKHLNLFLHTPNAISWTFTLPANVKQANFHSAIAISESAPHEPIADGVTFEVYAEPDSEARQLVFSRYLAPDQRQWQPFDIPLINYIGKTITLYLTSNGGKNNIHDWAMYRYPYIDILLDPMTSSGDGAIRPSNTDLSPYTPKPTIGDFRFDTTDPSLWDVTGMELVQTDDRAVNTWRVGQDPSLRHNRPISVCLSDYTHIYVRMAASVDIKPRAMQIYYALDNQTAFREDRSLTIPLLADGEVHDYTFDLKLLELPHRSRLTGIRLDPVYNAVPWGENRVQIFDLRLIRSDKPKSFCD
jgi:hypothetical protein